MLHALFVRHHLRPGEFWKLPRGEQLFLLASIELELTEKPKPRAKGARNNADSR